MRERSSKGHINLRAFWLRRARRLIPALLLVVTVSIALASAVNRELLVNIQRQLIGALTFSTNWIEIWAGSDYFNESAQALFVTFWSLAVEEQFYLLWPLILIALVTVVASRFWRTVIAICAATASALLMVLLYDSNNATRVYYGTDTHLFGLMLGVALAFAFAGSETHNTNRTWQTVRPWLGLVAITGLTVLVFIVDNTASSTYRGALFLASALTALAVATLPGAETFFTRLCKTRPLVWVGERSYGIYLWHWPVLVVVSSSIAVNNDTTSPAWLIALFVLFATFVLSEISFRWIENPVRENGFLPTWQKVRFSFRRSRSMLNWKPSVAATGAVVLVTLACIGIMTAPEKSQAQLSVESGERAIAEQNAQSQQKPEDSDKKSEEALAWPKDQSIPPGNYIVGMGDSVMSGAAPALYAKFPGIRIDAQPIRQWRDAPAIVQQMIDKGTIRNVVVLNYGTNAGFKEAESEAALRAILQALGPKRRVVLINVVGKSYWVPSTNERLQAISSEFPNTIVADWNSVVQAKPGLLHRDRTHPNNAGSAVYADLIAESLEKLGPG
jgi:peptidoglycan/LPS O-acetylase OafA/YrhL